MLRTRWIRKLQELTNLQRQRRHQAAKIRKPARLMLELLEERVTPDACSLAPGNVVVNFYGSGQSPAFQIPVVVNDNSGGVVTSGSVTINLVNGSSTLPLGSATVDTTGTADVDVNLGALPANLSIGNYQLEETYGGSGNFGACSASGTLTIGALSTTIVATSVTCSHSNTFADTQLANASIPIGEDAGNYAVLYEGMGGHTLQIADATINGNVGVGGTGVVQCAGHAAIDGTLNFSGSGSGQFDDTGDQDDDSNGNGSRPSAINVNDAAVTNALNTVNALCIAVGGLAGSSITIDGTQTIDEGKGQLKTVNGVNYRVFNVTSYQMGENDVLTIEGDGGGIPVVFNFNDNGGVNLSGDVVLTNGLVPDQVLWNFPTSGQQIHLQGNDSDRPSRGFQGILLAPNDTIDLENANLIGRVFGGDSADTQIIGQNTITAPTPVATIPATTTSWFTISAEVNCSTATVNGGAIRFEVACGGGFIQLGTAQVGANGVATLTATNPDPLEQLASLTPGSYPLVENYFGSNPFTLCNTISTLTITPVPTTVSAPRADVTVHNPTTFTITGSVNSPSGPVASGTVTVTLVNGSTGRAIPLGTATPDPNGVYTLNVTGAPLAGISALPPRTYQLVANFTAAADSPNSGSTGYGTLTIRSASSSPLPGVATPALTTTIPPTSTGPGGGGGVSSTQSGMPPIVAALELALDAAMLPMLSDPGAVGELEMFAQVFWHRSIPTSVPQLLSEIQSLLPRAGLMLWPALGFADFLGADLPIENPMPS